MLSYSQIRVWQQCQRKWSYKYVYDLDEPIGKEALFSRLLLHPALAMCYSQPGKEPPIQEWWSHYLDEVQDEAARFDELHSPLVAMQVWIKYSRLAQEDLETYEFVGAESKYFSQQEYIAVPDIVLKERQTEKLLLIDFKYSKRERPDLSLQFHNQFVGQALTVNASQVMVVFLHGKLRAKMPVVEISREILQVARFRNELLTEVRQVRRQMMLAEKEQVFPKSAPEACFSYGKPCHFLSLCEAGTNRQALIEEMPKKEAHNE